MLYEVITIFDLIGEVYNIDSNKLKEDGTTYYDVQEDHVRNNFVQHTLYEVIRYFCTCLVVLTVICFINSVYYNNYYSFVSLSLLATSTQAVGVANALTKILELKDFIFFVPLIIFFIINGVLKRKGYFDFVSQIEVGKIRAMNRNNFVQHTLYEVIRDIENGFFGPVIGAFALDDIVEGAVFHDVYRHFNLILPG